MGNVAAGLDGELALGGAEREHGEGDVDGGLGGEPARWVDFELLARPVVGPLENVLDVIRVVGDGGAGKVQEAALRGVLGSIRMIVTRPIGIRRINWDEVKMEE